MQLHQAGPERPTNDVWLSQTCYQLGELCSVITACGISTPHTANPSTTTWVFQATYLRFSVEYEKIVNNHSESRNLSDSFRCHKWTKMRLQAKWLRWGNELGDWEFQPSFSMTVHHGIQTQLLKRKKRHREVAPSLLLIAFSYCSKC